MRIFMEFLSNVGIKPVFILNLLADYGTLQARCPSCGGKTTIGIKPVFILNLLADYGTLQARCPSYGGKTTIGIKPVFILNLLADYGALQARCPSYDGKNHLRFRLYRKLIPSAWTPRWALNCFSDTPRE